MKSGIFNIGVLAVSNALAFAITPMMMLVGSLLGGEMAPRTDWATMPIALMVVGTAVGVFPATRMMQGIGRKYALWAFMLLGFLAALLASHSLVLKNFGLFCFCSFLVGITNAALQQIRFAAMECVELKKATSAASAVLLSGVGAAFIGPELAVWGRDITAVEYQGSFWLVSMCSVAAALVLSVYSPAELRENDAAVVARPLSQMLQTPAFVLAVASGAVAYVVMTFIMTGTPISMHNHFGHSLVDTKWVIQSHIAAMFLPSLLSPWLVKLFGLRGMMMMGLTCYGVTIIVGNIDTSVMGFWTQLVLLGIGWNFLFVAGTAMLSSCYLPGEQYKAQSFNDGVVFSIQALASLSAGWVMSVASWQSTLLICLLPVIFMIAILLWNQRTTKFSLG